MGHHLGRSARAVLLSRHSLPPLGDCSGLESHARCFRAGTPRRRRCFPLSLHYSSQVFHPAMWSAERRRARASAATRRCPSVAERAAHARDLRNAPCAVGCPKPCRVGLVRAHRGRWRGEQGAPAKPATPREAPWREPESESLSALGAQRARGRRDFAPEIYGGRRALESGERSSSRPMSPIGCFDVSRK
jgi:hypothetical protein